MHEHDELQRELDSGEVITMYKLEQDYPPGKPWEVACWTSTYGDNRWTSYFATEAEAFREYMRY
jgi:hypothetical protein